MNGVTEVALTLLDVLDDFSEIKICTGYRLNEMHVRSLPAREDLLSQVTPVFTSLPGWSRDITGVRDADDLPTAALNYLQEIERRLGAPISMVGVGPAREQLVPRTRDAAMLGAA
jgi:adenylosuccinate synthase